MQGASMEKTVAGRNCIITGATRGLGGKIAEALWDAGANLLLIARTQHNLEAMLNRLPRFTGQAVYAMNADLGDPLSVDSIVSKAKEKFGSVDVLVNNAGIQGPIGPVWANDWHEWQRTMQVDLMAPVALCRQCAPFMGKKGRSKIINISGGGATGPRAHFSAYATAKAGLVRFSETLAEETKDMSIDVNCIAPGAMNTAMIAEIVRSGEDAAGKREYEVAVRVQASEDAALERAASLCVFLASSASDGITGKLISAQWDPWEELPFHLDDLKTDIYTLRRIVPKDRGKTWGDRK